MNFGFLKWLIQLIWSAVEFDALRGGGMMGVSGDVFKRSQVSNTTKEFPSGIKDLSCRLTTKKRKIAQDKNPIFIHLIFLHFQSIILFWKAVVLDYNLIYKYWILFFKIFYLFWILSEYFPLRSDSQDRFCLAKRTFSCIVDLEAQIFVLLQTATMVCLVFTLAAVITACVSGQPMLPPLPVKGENHVFSFLCSQVFLFNKHKSTNVTNAIVPVSDGCHQVDSEVGIFRMEGEAVILHFPIFLGVLKARKILPPAAAFLISKKNGTDAVTYQGEGRIQQHHTQLWLLPAQTSDSGEYSCTYR